MEHACRDRMQKRYPIWCFRRARVFANARCKMHGARRVLARCEKPLFYRLFPHAGDRGAWVEGVSLLPLTLCPLRCCTMAVFEFLATHGSSLRPTFGSS